MKITSQEINEIAQELEAGMKVCINREIFEIRPILYWVDVNDSDFWMEEVEEVEEAE